MFRLCLLLFSGGFLIQPNDGSAAGEDVSILASSFPPEGKEPISLNQNGESTKSSDTPPTVPPLPLHSDWPFFPFFNPSLYYNPYYNGVSSSWFKSLVDQYKNDLEMITHRQNQIMKYAECSSSDTDKCMKVTEPDATEHIRALNYWNWGSSSPDYGYVTSDKLYALMNSFKTSIEKLTVRQNMLYEYIQCSCMAKTECNTSIKPVLDVMFSNNGNTTGQLFQSLFVPQSSYYNPASSFFQTLSSYLSQIPSWFAFNFNPIVSAFGSYQPFSTSYTSSSTPSTSSATTPVSSYTYPQTTTYTSPTTSYVGTYSSGGQPVYSSSSSYSSSTGSGQHVSGGHISTAGGGNPSHEEYFVSSNGDNVHISSSPSGKGVSVSSLRPGQRVRRSAEAQGFVGGVRLNPAQVGLNAAQAGVQVGYNAAQLGAQIGAAAAQQGVNAASAGVSAVNSGLTTLLYSAQG